MHVTVFQLALIKDDIKADMLSQNPAELQISVLVNYFQFLDYSIRMVTVMQQFVVRVACSTACI